MNSRQFGISFLVIFVIAIIFQLSTGRTTPLAFVTSVVVALVLGFLATLLLGVIRTK